ncbi:MAG: hypothetical protein KC910_13450 [Candidatus Eremiobacteraeota bacterium]|nr:hypothetical protein [Candidatus Eremiobacteraeota bacterium]
MTESRTSPEQQQLAELRRQAVAKGYSLRRVNGKRVLEPPEPQPGLVERMADQFGSRQHLNDSVKFARGELEAAVTMNRTGFDVCTMGARSVMDAYNDFKHPGRTLRRPFETLERVAQKGKHFADQPQELVVEVKGGARRVLSNITGPFRDGEMRQAGRITFAAIDVTVHGVAAARARMPRRSPEVPTSIGPQGPGAGPLPDKPVEKPSDLQLLGDVFSRLNSASQVKRDP